MKRTKALFWLALALLIAGGYTAARAQQEGVSHPPQDVPQTSTEPEVEVIVPAQGAAMPAPPPVAEVPAPKPSPAVAMAAAPPPMPPGGYVPPPTSDASGDYGVVQMPHPPNQLVIGTVLKVRVADALSSTFAQRGSAFQGTLAEAVRQDGRILLPAGSVVSGRVTIAEDRRMAQGRARLHLRPEEVTLPDGRTYSLRARVIDTDQYKTLRVDAEGTILSRPNIAKGLGITAGTAGVGAASGAVIGGPVGAVAGTIVGAGVGGGHMLMTTQEAVLPANSTVTFELLAPINVAMN